MNNLEDDWIRVVNAFLKVKDSHWSPRVKIFFIPKELRQADNRGIDFAIRRLLDSEEYSSRIRLYGGPSGTIPRNPFKYKGRVYSLLSIKDLNKNVPFGPIIPLV